MQKESLLLIILVGVIIFSLYGLTHQAVQFEDSNQQVTGYQAFVETDSRVQIQAFVAIAKSANLSAGINFGAIAVLPISQANGTGNYNPTNISGPISNFGNVTEYNITVSTDSNSAVDFCIRANAPLSIPGADEIGLGNYTWQNSTIANSSEPLKFGKRITTSFQDDTKSISPGGSNHYRFWLNVSASQAPGTYNNTIHFKAIPLSGIC